MLGDLGPTPKEQAIVRALTHLASMLTGSLEVGTLADLIVVDRNPFEVEAREISELDVVLTLLWGEAVHGQLPAAASLATADVDSVAIRVD
jgi:imidazolonepropionase-like amidohydrolase